MLDRKAADALILCSVMAAFVAGTATLFFSLTKTYGFSLWNLLDVALFWGLAFGVIKRSRLCAIVLFVYNIANRVDMWVRSHDIWLTLGPIALLFLALYFLGVVGTFMHHRLKRS